MIRILFICHGNICRSPMAEFYFRELVKKAGRERDYVVASAAVSPEEWGNPVYPPARRLLNAHGISCEGKRARQLTKKDYDAYNLLIGMEESNRRGMLRICGGDPEGKISLLMDWTGSPRPVADPWYTDDFDAAWRDVTEGCEALFRKLEER